MIRGGFLVVFLRRVLSVAVPIALLAGCSAISDSLRSASSIDYKSASKGPKLEVPPDLVTPKADNAFSVPAGPSAGTTYSAYSRSRTAATDAAAAGGTGAAGTEVLPQSGAARIVREGNQRWLVVDLPPAKVWPVVRDFWLDSGFALMLDNPQAGIMETDWKEQRPPTDSWLRNKLASVLGSAYSSGIREKFRARLEVAGNGTDVFVSQRGMTETLVGVQADSTVWTMNPPSPEIEAEYLQRLALKFLPEQVKAKDAAALETVVLPSRSKLIDIDGRSFVQLPDTFDRSWRQVGLALDRSGFTVEDRDRSNGIYYIRYVDTNEADNQPGLFDRVFGTGAKRNLAGKKFRVTVNADSAGSRVGVLDDNGALPATDTDKRLAKQIVTVLNDQLR
jgi:outer membrane protein assembly factor BamC